MYERRAIKVLLAPDTSLPWIPVKLWARLRDGYSVEGRENEGRRARVTLSRPGFPTSAGSEVAVSLDYHTRLELGQPAAIDK